MPAAAFAPLADALLTGGGAFPEHTAARYAAAAAAFASRLRFFHWELEFPEVFFDRDGSGRIAPGFDAVLGNPPWEMLRADHGDGDSRAAARRAAAAAIRFTRDSGAYQAQGDGHANRYQLFVERAVALTRHGGRIGLVLPSGLATDQGSAALRRMVLSRCDVDSLVGIDNRQAIFPIHRSVRFLLMSATAGRATGRIACHFDVGTTAGVEAIDDDDSGATAVALTPSAIERLSGPSLVIPQLRSAVDLQVCERAASLFPPLGSDQGWNARFGRELNATDDRLLLRARGRGLPVLGGRHLEPFRADVGAATRAISVRDAVRTLGVGRIDRPRLAYRDVASATNRLTLIAAVVPAGVVTTHTVFCLRSDLAARDQLLLCGLFNSLVVNYLVRLRVTTHVGIATVERLPVPRREQAPRRARRIASLARLLSRRMNAAAFAVLNAEAAHMYRLDRAELAHVLGTFPLVDRADRSAALAAFDRTAGAAGIRDGG
jgi:hypothetical protein